MLQPQPVGPGQVLNPNGYNGRKRPPVLRKALNDLLERNDGENAKRVAQRLMSIARGDIGGAADSVAAIKLLDVLLKDENRALGDSNTPEGGALLRTIRVIDVSFDARLQVPPVPGLVIDVPKRPDTATEDANT